MADEIVNIWKKVEGKTAPLFRIDWLLLVSALLISGLGLITMNSFVGQSYYFDRQLVWLGISLLVFFVASMVDWHFLRRSKVVVILFSLSCFLLLLLFIIGHVARGAQSWFSLWGFSFQPSDPVKLVLIIILAKYFSRRHIEIAHIRHIIVSGFYAFVLFLLVLLQPDFGSAIILFGLWLGMVLVSGISKKHLFAVIAVGVLSFLFLWNFAFHPYQKQRIVTFIHPLTDIRGTGYNAYQSTIAVGSGRILGKGVGYGTQSKLQFLPEYQTDFIFAAFAEEWGFIGASVLLAIYGVLLWRILENALRGASNFETFFGLGLAVLFIVHIIVHVGMNIGLLPVTGTTIPFMSYGGSHLVTEFLGLGILMGMRKYNRPAERNLGNNEIPGIMS
jgi:rod shape determining protein RodA